jgi:selenocysteine-specific elongation factor
VYLIGTAGHVDHGKTTLVKFLTGKDTDNLKEEKRRGLTIDLGFASFYGSDGMQIGIIDVPGHERFIKNMASGAWALNCALLLVAADDGWMAQTEDHALILKGMGTSEVLLVITKIDLVSCERSHEVEQQALYRCSQIFNKPCDSIKISCHKNIGLIELTSKISMLVKKADERYFPSCMYIDRTFTLSGTGVIATGTLMGQSIHEGDEATLLPGNEIIKIRSIQQFDKQVTTAFPNSRTALNIQSVKNDRVSKGMCITQSPSLLQVSKEILVLVRPPKETESLHIRNHQEVGIAYGTRHSLCQLHFISDGSDKINRKTVVARLVTQDEGIWFWKQRLIVFQPGKSTVLAFGTIVWSVSGTPSMYKKIARLIYERENILDEIDEQGYLALVIHGFFNCNRKLEESIVLCGERYDAFGTWLIKRSLHTVISKQIIDMVTTSGRIPLVDLKKQLSIDDAVSDVIIRQLLTKELIRRKNSLLCPVGKVKITISPQAETLLGKITAKGMFGYEIKLLSREEKQTLGELLRDEQAIIIGEMFVYSSEIYVTIVKKIIGQKKKGDLFSIADAKQHVNLSRKYMIPLLNKMEEQKLVARIGDMRKIL